MALTKVRKVAIARQRYNCPTCFAPAGQRCKAVTSGSFAGRPMKGVHEARVREVDRFYREENQT